MNEAHFKHLLDLYITGQISEPAEKDFFDLVKKEEYSHLLEQILQQEWEQGRYEEMENPLLASLIEQHVINKIREKKKTTPVKHLSIFRRYRIAAAAVFIGAILSVGYLYFNKQSQKQIAKTETLPGIKNDIAPGGNKAILTLGDGTRIVLDSAKNGTLTQQGNTKILKSDNGQVTYNSSSIKGEILYNTISTPRGGQYQIVLADGSKVWLNAASSLRFPTAFSGKERRVEITGEAYFEITRNEAAPFIVSNNGAEVQVLGTHFNVMAYSDEAVLKVTLLEGSVKFINDDISTILKPGQQSQLTKTGQINVLNDVDVGEVMAWKNGFFYFNKADIETVMRQVSRWYNVDVIYHNKKTNDLFHADIPRDTKLSEVLKVLEIAGDVQFKIEGQKVIVSY